VPGVRTKESSRVRGIDVGLPAVLGTAGVVTGHVKSQEIETTTATTTKAIALFFPYFICMFWASNKFHVCRQAAATAN